MKTEDFLIGHFYKIHHMIDDKRLMQHPFLYLGREIRTGGFLFNFLQ